jgi:hypothetical protein
LRKKNDSYSNTFLRQAQDKLAQHDKEQKPSAVAISFSVKQQAWPIEKVYKACTGSKHSPAEKTKTR